MLSVVFIYFVYWKKMVLITDSILSSSGTPIIRIIHHTILTPQLLNQKNRISYSPLNHGQSIAVLAGKQAESEPLS